ncbi:DUF4411 family protein [Salinarimonas sp.]|uniref:DUF4411 family protein n=1 Tax=Salinarimonas sp. TaxID=2766526 RepID=UPI0032D9A421
MKYLLDANVFIEASNRYYAFDICPGFWAWMDIVTGADAASVALVRDEIASGADLLAEWVKDRAAEPWFLPVDDTATQVAFQAVAAHVASGPYTPQAQARFLSGADPWLVAKAMIAGCTIVTHEVAAPGAKKRVPLPNVCAHFGVATLNTFDAMRALKASLALAA